jgi:hypothetical protein
MRLRVLGMLVFASGLALSAIGVAHANSNPPSTVSKLPIPSSRAPELDPSALGSGLALLGGGILLLAERRRPNRQEG